MWVTSHSRSLEIPFESFCSPYTATLAVSLATETLSVKEWHDIEKGVRGCPRSLKVAPVDRYNLWLTICLSLSLS